MRCRNTGYSVPGSSLYCPACGMPRIGIGSGLRCGKWSKRQRARYGGGGAEPGRGESRNGGDTVDG